MRKRRGRTRNKEAVELDVTAFMNLMVVLVPFLLITAVFAQLSIIELNLPNLGDAKNNKKDKPSFNLKITIRKKSLVVSDDRGLIKRIPNTKTGHNYEQLSTIVQQLKARYPTKTNATVLAERNTEYDSLIQVMDSLRVTFNEAKEPIVLFPDISIGDAPR